MPIGNGKCIDILVIGGGIVGITLALELKRCFTDLDVAILDKEQDFGLHASGRNSGVLHAGFYYSADSLKARFTRDGNRLMTEYCLERELPINRCGKLVVARNHEEVAGLHLLKQRGDANGVELQWLTEQQAREVEPRVKTVEGSLWSATTSSIDPRQIVASLLEDARKQGIRLLADTTYLGHTSDSVVSTSTGPLQVGYVVNAAGLYADRIAKDYGFATDYAILPFKGLYLKSAEPPGRLNTHIYPVPDLKNPFLGVHFTITVDGHVKIGPTAIPAFWREHYQGLENFHFGEMIEIVTRELGLLLNNHFSFKRLAVTEMMRYSRNSVIRDAAKLLEGVNRADYRDWGAPGIRAQLVNLKSRKLEMDFYYEGDDRSFHVLNAVSPAFTCAFSFSAFLATKIASLMR
jgi:L-2-hydroxyglutarate oxidase LhgO